MTRQRKLLATGMTSVMLAVFAIATPPASAVDYYPSYELPAAITTTNYEIAFIMVAIGLIILAVDSLLFLVHFLWQRRPSQRRKLAAATWSQEQS